MQRKRPLSIAVFVLVVSTVTIASTKIEIVHDPFSHVYQPRKPFSETTRPASREKSEQPAVWNANLFATIMAGQSSMANVDGTVIRLGEVLNGYKLLSVSRTSAAFEKNGKQFVLKMESSASQR